MRGPVDREELAETAGWYEAAGIEPRFEMCPYADASAVEGLASLGFVARLFESVFFRSLSEGDTFETPRPRPRGLELRMVDPDDPRLVRAYSETVMPPLFAEAHPPTEADYRSMERIVRHPRTVCIAAWMDGRIVGGGSMEVAGEIGALFALAVAADYRRRGVQQALIAERLRLARDGGARVATIGCRLGQNPVATERNARRMGFQVAYTKVALVRPGEGLRPVTS
jgi:GNAT superfamily N-acetyltransferase